jgi:hypothetical protein
MDLPEEAVELQTSRKAVLGQRDAAVPDQRGWIGAASVAPFAAGLTKQKALVRQRELISYGPERSGPKCIRLADFWGNEAVAGY